MIEPEGRNAGQRRPDRAVLVIAIGLLLIGILVAWDASRLGAGGAYAKIGPQTIPYVIALCLGGLAVLTVIAAYRGSFPAREKQDAAPVLWIVGGLIAQMVLIKFTGFSVATAALFAMTARGMGRINLPLALLAGFLISAVVWFIFARLLSLSLPTGPIENLILNAIDTLTPPKAAPGSPA
jgi:putative tricarboxylic transport membrane protein